MYTYNSYNIDYQMHCSVYPDTFMTSKSAQPIEKVCHNYPAAELPQNKKFVSNFSIDSILSSEKSQDIVHKMEEDFEMNSNEIHNELLRNFENGRAYVTPKEFYLCRPDMLEEEASKVEANASGNYTCCFCNKDYSRRHALKIHIRTHTGYKPLPCAICGKRFGDPSNLNKHKKVHKAIKESPTSLEKLPNTEKEKIQLLSKYISQENRCVFYRKMYIL